MKGDTVGIRPATSTDVGVLATLMSEFYAESSFMLPAAAAVPAFAALLGSPEQGAVWLAELNEKVVGHVVLVVAFSMEYGGLRGFIDDLYVQLPFRNRGIGAALLAAARTGADARGLRALFVETGLQDHPARALYARAGYADSGHALLVQPLRRPIHDG